jgi:hypothetical protein
MPRMTTSKLSSAAAIAAILAGLLFIAIQPLHPPDTLASVGTSAWPLIHTMSLVMVVLFLVGITGIYLSHVERLGWLGLVGYVVLSIALLLTLIGDAIEAYVQPVLVTRDAAFVQGMLNMILGLPNTGGDLGLLPVGWAIAGLCFPGGALILGAATFRAGYLSRWASAVFAIGLLASAPIVGMLGMPRLAAFPIGLGLAWLGYSLFTKQRGAVAQQAAAGQLAQPSEVAA